MLLWFGGSFLLFVRMSVYNGFVLIRRCFLFCCVGLLLGIERKVLWVCVFYVIKFFEGRGEDR